MDIKAATAVCNSVLEVAAFEDICMVMAIHSCDSDDTASVADEGKVPAQYFQKDEFSQAFWPPSQM